MTLEIKGRTGMFQTTICTMIIYSINKNIEFQMYPERITTINKEIMSVMAVRFHQRDDFTNNYTEMCIGSRQLLKCDQNLKGNYRRQRFPPTLQKPGISDTDHG